MDRRNFLRTTSGLMAGGLTASLASSLYGFPQESKYKDTIGLQLWTVRNQLADDKQATLKSIADAGYKQVEFGDVGQGLDLMPICKDLGLDATSSFLNWQSICNPKSKTAASLEKILEDAVKLNLKHLVFGYIGKPFRKTADQYKKHIDVCNQFGESCLKAGIQLCYHNHSFEFEKLDGGKAGFDLLMDGFDDKLCKFELDVFWVEIGGWNALETLERLGDRVSQVHLKDLKAGSETCYDEGRVPKDSFKELGNGVIDIGKVLSLSEKLGVVQCHVEQDQSPDPIKSIGQSMQHFRSL
ncbi:MAG: sugar phosphate isomerase/epimerase [Planctomycetota bacterium]